MSRMDILQILYKQIWKNDHWKQIDNAKKLVYNVSSMLLHNGKEKIGRSQTKHAIENHNNNNKDNTKDDDNKNDKKEFKSTSSPSLSSKITEYYIHPNMTLEERIQARAKHSQIMSEKVMSTSINQDQTTKATTTTTTNTTTIQNNCKNNTNLKNLVRFADCLRLYTRDMYSRSLGTRNTVMNMKYRTVSSKLLPSSALSSSTGVTSNSTTLSKLKKMKKTIGRKFITISLSQVCIHLRRVVLGSSGGGGSSTTVGLSETRFTKKDIIIILKKLCETVPEWISMITTTPTRTTSTDRLGAKNSNSTTMIRICEDVPYQVVRQKLSVDGHHFHHEKNQEEDMHMLDDNDIDCQDKKQHKRNQNVRKDLSSSSFAVSQPPSSTRTRTKTKTCLDRKNVTFEDDVLKLREKQLDIPIITESNQKDSLNSDSELLASSSSSSSSTTSSTSSPSSHQEKTSVVSSNTNDAYNDNDDEMNSSYSLSSSSTSSQLADEEVEKQSDYDNDYNSDTYSTSNHHVVDNDEADYDYEYDKDDDVDDDTDDDDYASILRNEFKKRNECNNNNKTSLRVNHNQHLIDADMNGGDIINTDCTNPRGLKLMFSLMNAGERI